MADSKRQLVRHHPEDLAMFLIMMMELMPVVDFESAVSCKVDAERESTSNQFTAGVP